MPISGHPSRGRTRPAPARPSPSVDHDTRPPTINHRAALVLIEMIREARRQNLAQSAPTTLRKVERVIRFAFYGRVSTEDQQDPASSKQWQLHRSKQLIEPAGGVVVTEFFDIGQSRSLPGSDDRRQPGSLSRWPGQTGASTRWSLASRSVPSTAISSV